MKTKERLGVKDTLNAAGKIQGGCFLSPTFSLPPPPRLTICRGRPGSKFSHSATHGHSHPLPAQPSWAILGAQEPLLSPPHPHPTPRLQSVTHRDRDSSPAPPTPILLQYFLGHSCALILLCVFPQDKYLNHFGKLHTHTHTQHTYVWIGNPICKQIC